MKRNIWLLTVVIMISIVFSGTQQAFSENPVTLKVMNWSQEQTEFYQDVAKEFQKKYPRITLQWDTMAQTQYREAIPLMFQSGDAPDVFFWISQARRELTVAELHNLGWIAPLNSEAPVSDEFLARWPKGSFLDGINRIDGKVYSFPFNDNKIWGPGYMFLNRSVLSAAGLDKDTAPKTWKELYETCKTVKEKAGVSCLAVPLKGNDLQRAWYPLAGSVMTDQFFDYKNGVHNIDDPKLLKAFSFLQKLHAEDLLLPGVNDKTFARQAMASGQAAIYFGGAWMPSVFKSMGFTDLDLGVASPPVPDDGPLGALAQLPTENKYFVSSQTKHAKEAWLFIEWMTQPDGFFVREYLKRGFGPLAFADNAKYIQEPVMVKMAKEIAPTLRVAYPLPVVACPDAGKSKALTEAGNIRNNWEFQAMVEALTSGLDFAPIAREIAEAKDAKFLEVLKKEAEEGLDVSADCFTFPNWEYNQDFDPADYNAK